GSATCESARRTPNTGGTATRRTIVPRIATAIPRATRSGDNRAIAIARSAAMPAGAAKVGRNARDGTRVRRIREIVGTRSASVAADGRRARAKEREMNRARVVSGLAVALLCLAGMARAEGSRGLDVELWTNRGQDAVYQPGDPLEVKVKTSDDAYLLV